MAKIRSIATLTLDGGLLCFNFINTVYAWRGASLHDYLTSYDDVIAWCKKVNILTAAQRSSLLQEAKLHPQYATKALLKIIAAREQLYHLFAAIAADKDKQLPPDVLASLNDTISQTFAHLHFAVARQQVSLVWKTGAADLLQPLWLIFKSAFDTLTSGTRSSIKECPGCGWIFIDNTKNNKRRWCSVTGCGSAEKAKKYYDKKKESRE